MNNIVITGIGVISSLGVGKDRFRENCLAAETGLKKITVFDTSGFQSDIGGYVDNFNPREFMPPAVYRRMSRISRMTVAACIEALSDSGIRLEEVDKERVAIIMGTSLGSSSHVEDFYVSLLQEGPRGAQPLLFPETVPNAAASHVAIFHKITGPNTTFCQNDISAENAMLYAKNLLLQNRVDVVIVGGADELSIMQYSCYSALGLLCKIKTDDKNPVRLLPGKGLVPGEGAGVLIMEREGAARSRGAKIYGCLESGVCTGGATGVAGYDHSGYQACRAVTFALEQAGVRLDEIDQIDVSANSSVLDRIEYKQLEQIYAGDINGLHVTPLKYLTGDFGGAGAVRAAAILLSMHAGQYLPAVSAAALKNGSENPINWTTHAERKTHKEINRTLMTTTSFGGGNACLIFSKR